MSNPTNIHAPRIRPRPRPQAAAPSPTADPDYEVGYGRPPEQHRFKPGRSGNPKGRPKGARGMNAMIRDMLEKKVELRLEGRLCKVMRIQALLLKQMELAAKGDLRALDRVIMAYRQAVPEPIVEVAHGSETDGTAADAAIIATFLQMMADEQANGAER